MVHLVRTREVRSREVRPFSERRFSPDGTLPSAHVRAPRHADFSRVEAARSPHAESPPRGGARTFRVRTSRGSPLARSPHAKSPHISHVRTSCVRTSLEWRSARSPNAKSPQVGILKPEVSQTERFSVKC